MRILQSPGFVAISYELIHDTRVIPLDAASPRGSLTPAIRTYMGDANGRWEWRDAGDLFETSNLKVKHPRGRHRGFGLIERVHPHRAALDPTIRSTFVDPAMLDRAVDGGPGHESAAGRRSASSNTRAARATTACSTCSPPRGCPTNRAGRLGARDEVERTKRRQAAAP